MAVRREKTKIGPITKVTPRRGISMEFNYTWTINNFELRGVYESPIFSPGCSEKIEFGLKLSGITGRPTLCVLPCKIPEMSVILSLTALSSISNSNAAGAKKIWVSETYQIRSSAVVQEYSFCGNSMSANGYYDFHNWTHNFYLSNNKQINVIADFKIFFPPCSTWAIEKIKVPPCSLFDNLKELLEKHEHSDVIFDVCGQQIPAHKTILSMRSPVFAAMFKVEMKENLQNRVEVNDIEANIFTEMLRYIYTGKPENIGAATATKLLAAAEKYDLKGLKLMCEETLRLALTVKTAAYTLVLADQFDAKLLKERTAKFINFNLKEVMATEGFIGMTKSRPILMTEVLQAAHN